MSVIPQEFGEHMRASMREQLLAWRSLLDNWIDSVEESELRARERGAADAELRTRERGAGGEEQGPGVQQRSTVVVEETAARPPENDPTVQVGLSDEETGRRPEAR